MENEKTNIKDSVLPTKMAKKDAERNKKVEEAYKKILATEEGKTVIWDLLSYAEIYGDAFTGNSSTFYKLGLQRFGKRVIERINALDPKAYAKLLLEYNDN
jgi:hypothetical protein